MDFVRSYFGTNETLTSWTLLAHFFSKSVLIQCWFSSDLEKNKPKVCNWSEFHLNLSYFLQNPYFKRPGWRLNHSFYRKFGFNEFVANILRDNMGSKKISLQTKKKWGRFLTYSIFLIGISAPKFLNLVWKFSCQPQKGQFLFLFFKFLSVSK